MAAAPPVTGNIALLIDADNASPASLDPVLTVLAELGTVNIRRIYGNWKKPALKTWADKTLTHGIEPYQQFDLTKGKNATDMKMTIDAMDLLFGGRVTGFGIMSSDSDFTPLAMRIRQEGIPVYGFGTMKTPEGFREACTRFIDVAALTRAHEAEQSAPPVKAENGVDAGMLALLIDAYNAAKRDERGFAALSEIGSLAGNRSSFDVRNYGFKRLSDLMNKVPNFQSELRDGRMFVKRIN
ncbi:NYN domain-containing protein [Sphingomonas sp. G-3-2-10]|uniref:NYN domain-containing protein n=1 Tax=Sphingomonas sp. G-3-2-10 TaxID=2728838 RepID=UPI00146E9E22|nr:NYN domain-containing protein [Sphingomonas sp. G-3-2-10]NML05346.1 NYN domain-containing protein [Sphingomonas sp. G-3-2-10]